MQINSFNAQNNSTSFGRVFFHNKKGIAKFSKEVINNLVDSEMVKEFSKRKDYDLFITVDANKKTLKYKIKSVGQGLQGMLNNFIAPWEKLWATTLSKFDSDLYIEAWHPSKKTAQAYRLQKKQETIERKARLKKALDAEKVIQKEKINILTKAEKQNKITTEA